MTAQCQVCLLGRLGPLQAAGGVGEQVAVIGDTDGRDTVGTKIKTKPGAAEGKEAGVNVDLIVATCSDMALPISFVFYDPPAQFVLKLNVALSVPVRVLAVLEQVAPLANGIELPDLDIALY